MRNDAFAMFGGYIGPVPTPLIIAAVCIAVVTVVLKKSALGLYIQSVGINKKASRSALGLYIQSVGINKKASRIAGLNSQKIIFLCYVLCGLCAGIAGVVASSRITSADSNNIGLNFEMDAILAVALGGNSLAGGRFNLAGAPSSAPTPSRPSPPPCTTWACPAPSTRCSRRSSSLSSWRSRRLR